LVDLLKSQTVTISAFSTKTKQALSKAGEYWFTNMLFHKYRFFYKKLTSAGEMCH